MSEKVFELERQNASLHSELQNEALQQRELQRQAVDLQHRLDDLQRQLAARRPVLRQKNGLPVTACGQIVEFVGTSGFRGVNTPPEHQTNLTDEWMVMQVNGYQALIMKKNPIAVQKYKVGGTEARYDQSDIKVSVDAWFSGIPRT
ncbi:MAG: hypothetical protein LBS28_03165 [Streptococcaceae bacterium]|nr:hypothetical protein [Streptococcaceae bacterium]